MYNKQIYPSDSFAKQSINCCEELVSHIEDKDYLKLLDKYFICISISIEFIYENFVFLKESQESLQ